MLETPVKASKRSARFADVRESRRSRSPSSGQRRADRRAYELSLGRAKKDSEHANRQLAGTHDSRGQKKIALHHQEQQQQQPQHQSNTPDANQPIVVLRSPVPLEPQAMVAMKLHAVQREISSIKNPPPQATLRDNTRSDQLPPKLDKKEKSGKRRASKGPEPASNSSGPPPPEQKQPLDQPHQLHQSPKQVQYSPTDKPLHCIFCDKWCIPRMECVKGNGKCEPNILKVTRDQARKWHKEEGIPVRMRKVELMESDLLWLARKAFLADFKNP